MKNGSGNREQKPLRPYCHEKTGISSWLEASLDVFGLYCVRPVVCAVMVGVQVQTWRNCRTGEHRTAIRGKVVIITVGLYTVSVTLVPSPWSGPVSATLSGAWLASSFVVWAMDIGMGATSDRWQSVLNDCIFTGWAYGGATVPIGIDSGPFVVGLLKLRYVG